MESLDAVMFSNMDGLLDFSFDFGDEENNEEEDGRSNSEKRPSLVSKSHRRGAHVRLPDESDSDGDRSRSFPQVYEEDDDEEEVEELEWLSNQDVFPSIETFDFLSPEKPSYGGAGDNQKLQSPVSVLHETSSSSNSSSSSGSSYGFPVRAARSMRRRRRRSSFTNLLLSSGDHQQQWWFWYQKLNNNKNNEKKGSGIIDSTTATAKIGTTTTTTGGRGEGGVRRCQHCLAEKTPQWRAGPMGPKTLCNACGVRYKSGRLVPEYRPASSPSFSKDLHSNSHRKILEMRRKKQKKQQTSLQCLGNG